jgi:hypothetical protein
VNHTIPTCPAGASIIDAMDTLHIMGLKEQFERGQKWIELTFDWNQVVRLTSQ